jgi:hypothetical protein
MDLVGSLGIGAVVGWMVGRFVPGRYLWRLLLAVGLAVGVTLLEIGWFAGIKGIISAICAGTLSFFIHRLWLQELTD